MHALIISRSRCFSRRLSRALLLVGLISFSFVSARVVATEILVKNGVSPSAVVYGPEEVGERFAARLTSPIDGTIVGVRVLWGSESGGAAPSQEGAIRISTTDGTSTPRPGTVLATINAPVLMDGGVNEFRFLDPTTNLIPLSVPISAGEDFFVDLETVNVYPNTSNRPGVLSEQFATFDLTRNLIHAPRVATLMYWFNPAIGIADAKNWGLQAIIQPVPEPSTYALAAIGVIGLLAFRRRKAAAAV
jgi:hypothetical protein